MKNIRETMKIINHSDFKENLIANNQKSLHYYNYTLNFSSFKSDFDSDVVKTPDQVYEYCLNFFTFDKIKKIIAHEKACADVNPFYGSSFQPLDGPFFSGMVLATTDQFTVILMALHGYEIDVAKQRKAGERRTLGFGGVGSFIHFYRANDIKLRTWRIESFDDSEDLSSGRLKPVNCGEQHFSTGDSRAFGSDETFEYCCQAGSSGLMLQVQMHVGGPPVALEFDYDTGTLVGASSPAQEPTRLQMLATAMRLFDRQDAFDDVASLLDHPAHFVRWHAMRECIGMDAERALPLLLKLSANDPQPSVRRAADKTLTQFYSEHCAIAAE